MLDVCSSCFDNAGRGVRSYLQGLLIIIASAFLRLEEHVAFVNNHFKEHQNKKKPPSRYTQLRYRVGARQLATEFIGTARPGDSFGALR